jgi:hypothetical protein
MKHPALVAFGSVAFVVALAAAPMISTAAPDPTPTPVPMAHPDLSSMSFMMGTWTCTQMLRGKERPDTSTTTMGYDGTWMVTEDTAPPFDAYRTFAVKSTNYMTYDASTKQWIQTGVDNTGGYYTTTSPGWQANTITWTTKGLDGSSATDVTTKVSDTETNDVSTGTDPTGKITKLTIHCTKSSS